MKKVEKFNIIEITENEVEELKRKLDNKELIKSNTKIKINCKECGCECIKFPDTRRINNWLLCVKCSSRKSHIEKHGSLEQYQIDMNNKRRETCIKKYGSYEKAQEIRLQHQKENNKKKTGYEYTFQNPVVKNKIKQTISIKYNNGVPIENVSQIKTIRDKIKQTCKEKYGTEEYLASKECKEKTKQTSRLKYNTDSPNSADIVKQHKVESVYKKYGVKNVNQLKEVREKIYKTCIERYGKLWNTYKYKYDNIKFDSGWELIYYIWLKDHNVNFEYHPKINFDYIDENGKNSKYEPDFLIDNKLYEIKGDHFFNEQKQLINPYDENKPLCLKKQQCMIDNGVKILTSIDLKNSFDYFNTLNLNLSNFRVKKEEK